MRLIQLRPNKKVNNDKMSEQKEKYINPLTDFGFKKLFGTEPNKSLLIDFLNQILPDQKIKDLTYSSGEKLGRRFRDDVDAHGAQASWPRLDRLCHLRRAERGRLCHALQGR